MFQTLLALRNTMQQHECNNQKTTRAPSQYNKITLHYFRKGKRKAMKGKSNTWILSIKQRNVYTSKFRVLQNLSTRLLQSDATFDSSSPLWDTNGGRSVQERWCYPIERCLNTIRKKCRKKHKIETCIAEARAWKLTPSTQPQGVQKMWTIWHIYIFRYAKIYISTMYLFRMGDTYQGYVIYNYDVEIEVILRVAMKSG
jgi:hypothetical protein